MIVLYINPDGYPLMIDEETMKEAKKSLKEEKRRERKVCKGKMLRQAMKDMIPEITELVA
jgi:hypothetical protein